MLSKLKVGSYAGANPNFAGVGGTKFPSVETYSSILITSSFAKDEIISIPVKFALSSTPTKL